MIRRSGERLIAVLAILTLLALVTAACQPQTTATQPTAQPAATQAAPAPEDTEAPADEPAPAAEAGGSLTVLTKQEPDTMDPHQTQSRYASIILDAMFDPLVWFDAEQQIHPGLAESWELSEDGLTWTFKLREDVTFHDGTPFNAEAAKYNFDRMVDPEIMSVGAGVLIGPYESSEVVDEYTVQVNFSEPNGAFLNTLADPYGWLVMVSPAAAEEFGSDFNLQPVGTGPFMFEDYVPQEMVSLVRNPDYNWGPEFAPNTGPAALDRIVFRFVNEDSTRLAALETGEADVVMEVPPLEVNRISENSDFELISSPVPGVAVNAIMNVMKPPTDDILVRQAILHAVDQEHFVNVLWEGHWQGAHSILAPNTWAYDEEAASLYSYDPERAQELLEEAGWTVGADGIREKDGQRLEVVYLALFAPPYDPGEVIQAQLREVGIEMEYQVLEGAQHRAASRRGDHNLSWTRWVSIDPSVLDTYFNSQNIGTGFNYTHFADPEVDELLARGREETDPELRREVFVELQRHIMENAWTLPMHETVMIVAMKTQVEGFELGPAGFMPWNYNNWRISQ